MFIKEEEEEEEVQSVCLLARTPQFHWHTLMKIGRDVSAGSFLMGGSRKPGSRASFLWEELKVTELQNVTQEEWEREQE